mmetsp:Transcript_27472/g.87370  ORF Transcript_27472/g.87370 Transcript_27472/m.87370 type:complete len:245 (+) Transcript_27472:1952-2686(+)
MPSHQPAVLGRALLPHVRAVARILRVRIVADPGLVHRRVLLQVPHAAVAPRLPTRVVKLLDVPASPSPPPPPSRNPQGVRDGPTTDVDWAGEGDVKPTTVFPTNLTGDPSSLRMMMMSGDEITSPSRASDNDSPGLAKMIAEKKDMEQRLMQLELDVAERLVEEAEARTKQLQEQLQKQMQETRRLKANLKTRIDRRAGVVKKRRSPKAKPAAAGGPAVLDDLDEVDMGEEGDGGEVVSDVAEL